MTRTKSSLISLVLTVFLSSVTIILALEELNTGILLKNVDRTIDLQSHLTKITTKLVVENIGKSPIKHFYFGIEPHKRAGLSYISAHTRDASRTELILWETKLRGHEEQNLYKIELKDPIQPGRTSPVEVETVSTHELDPYPKQITQKEKQLVRYTGNINVWSPYPVQRQTTNIVLPSRNIESFTRIKPVSVSDTTIIYGPLEKRLPYTQEGFAVHFENSNKFLTITRLERLLELSHWGNIAVEETIDLLHTGALLKGSFSRYEYSRESKSGQASIQSFDTILPAAASDIYYRDEIGNISTSHTRVKKDSVDVNLRPRFPLFGGWKTHYTIGYNVPSYEYLFQNGEEFVLKMRVLDHIFDDMVVDELVLKIILPEGSKNLELFLPYDATRLSDSLHYSYLDTFGRPVISVTKRNLVEHHIQDFQLKYNFPRILMLQEPLLVAVALYLLFLLVIIYVRLDFSIDKDEASESRLRIAGQCEKILGAQDKRVTSYNELDEHLVYLKANKDTAAFLSAMKSINQEYKNATNTVNELAQKLRSDSADVYERIQELQKYDKQLKEFYNQQQALYVDKLVPGKISRQQFVDAEGIITRKKEECVEKINAVVKSLH
ncbi:dolichyl-diphosphooligosaccharide--protein glycosyltransferase subunit 1 [Diachasma alloeum]|uniref:dolichyl-diphosphooligosaccharide--protein glycosyltransferase subunit 1 n=1 Tax=Diachasma alloeum TaxID=454923 RepID=UPI0007384E79|nr:dolichyl-diphosphooligosaccharide--protein glycosyltransferase subunit 1 [Diachasma alloeum]